MKAGASPYTSRAQGVPSSRKSRSMFVARSSRRSSSSEAGTPGAAAVKCTGSSEPSRRRSGSSPGCGSSPSLVTSALKCAESKASTMGTLITSASSHSSGRYTPPSCSPLTRVRPYASFQSVARHTMGRRSTCARRKTWKASRNRRRPSRPGSSVVDAWRLSSPHSLSSSSAPISTVCDISASQRARSLAVMELPAPSRKTRLMARRRTSCLSCSPQSARAQACARQLPSLCVRSAKRVLQRALKFTRPASWRATTGARSVSWEKASSGMVPAGGSWKVDLGDSSNHQGELAPSDGEGDVTEWPSRTALRASSTASRDARALRVLCSGLGGLGLGGAGTLGATDVRARRAASTLPPVATSTSAAVARSMPGQASTRLDTGSMR
mmetsp:Transcript_14599/g.49447  ORF Transcript_14599/g.49447 Transcript_14599/m.49447 type:complete len:383 (-) Transcript_14599:19-1167(-)